MDCEVLTLWGASPRLFFVLYSIWAGLIKVP